LAKRPVDQAKRITLHQKNLNIKSAKVIVEDKKGVKSEIKVSRIVCHKAYDELRIHTDKNLYSSKYEIYVEFDSIITKNMDGIYPCVFEDEGVQKKLIATQFESHHAREAFPCIDEPEAKATFKLALTHAENETALSNTPKLTESTDKNKTTSTFDITPVMSTYLLAFVVGELDYLEAVSKNGVKIRTYSVPKHVKTSKFALLTAVKAMDFYEEYYDIPFPLPKCDFVALPDFASGAMENWGLITFREQLLLCDDHTSLSTKQYIAIVVAHELTHQWFGNLVTMRWWTDLWLNEGFASWMEYLAVDQLFPEWNLWTQFGVDEQQSALSADALEFTHPVEVPVKHPDEIRTIFDIISYQKGASVIHMLNDYLGPEIFRDGLRYYLKKYSYKNTNTVDLWQALEDVSKKPVTKFMGVWTSKSGFPIISVEKNENNYVISQKRFVANPKSLARQDPTIWPVPLLTEDIDINTIEKRKITVPVKNTSGVLMLNRGQTGYYRVDYSHELQNNIMSELKAGKLDHIDRMGLLSDGFEVTKAGYQPIDEYLDLLANFSDESSLAVWEIIAGSIGTIRNRLSQNDEDENLRNAMKSFVLMLVDRQLGRLGWDEIKGETHLDSLLRPLIIGLASSSEDQNTISKALELYKLKMTDNHHINPDLRGTIYSVVARYGGRKEFNELLDLYTKTHSGDEKLALTAGMTSFKQPEIIKEVLALIKTDTIRLQDTGYWLAYSFMNRFSRKLTWDWLVQNWGWLKENNGTDMSFARMPVYAARNFSDDMMLKEYKKFFESKMEPMIDRSFKQGLEIIETNTAWHNRDSQKALNWFKSRQY
jgi:aminopeptidase N